MNVHASGTRLTHIAEPAQALRFVIVFLTLTLVTLAPRIWADEKETEDQRIARTLRGISTNLQFNRDNTVRLIRFSKSHVKDEHLTAIKSFQKLDYLAIVCPQISDAGIANAAELTNLDTLVLCESGLTDDGIGVIEKLSKLERLYLDNTAITDKSLEAVAKLTNLKVLSLVNTEITDEGVAHLSNLKQLKTLRLDGTSITNKALVSISTMPELELLYLTDCRVDSTTDLARLAKLKHVCLNGTSVSNDDIEAITNCKSLKTVELYRTNCDVDGLRQLRELRPKLKFFSDVPTTLTKKLEAPPTTSTSSQDVPPEPIHSEIRDRMAYSDQTPHFQRHVIPLLGRLGCNSRSCHGSFQGQGGFRLSMFGYDFDMDHENLSDRIDLENVNESLILNKPTSADEHEGGLRLPPGGWEQDLLRRWIEGGALGLSKTPAKFVRLDVSPAEIVFGNVGDTQSLRVVAVWSDGTREEVTSLTRFETKDDAIATVTKDGVVKATGKGDSHVIALYDNGIVPVPVILPVSDQTGTNYPQVETRTKIDEHVVTKLKRLGIVPSAISTDEEFLRRVSLDLVGTLPTADEVRAFTSDNSDDKRSRKIDELLQREPYVAWWTNLLCDLTGANAGYLGSTEMASPVAAQWQAWIELRVRENVGWDEIARGIITATSRRPGQTYADFAAEQSTYTRPGDPGFAALGNPMPHYWYRSNIATPQDKALSFGYTFMGVRLDCAQCHKHPFDQWSKQDFERFTQFFTRVKTGFAPDAADLHESMRNMLGVPVKLDTAALRRQSYLRIAKEGRPIPWREIYVDPPADKPQIATLLGAGDIDLSDYDDPREPLFDWLLSEPNHYFAKAFVNRVWAHYFNVGIINPPDDLNLANPPSNRPLLDCLTEGFIENKYDMKWLHRTITNSDTYQRSWKPNDSNRRDQHNFSHAILRRLPAEVAVDAVVQATANDLTAERLATTVKTRKITQHPRSYQTRSIDYSLLVFGKPLRTTNCDCERQNDPTLVQALFLRNDEETLAMLDRSDGWLTQLKKTTPEEIDVVATIETAYLRVLSRLPTKQEASDCADHVATAESKIDGLRDLLWSLLNTQEFITNH